MLSKPHPTIGKGSTKAARLEVLLEAAFEDRVVGIQRARDPSPVVLILSVRPAARRARQNREAATPPNPEPERACRPNENDTSG